MITDFSIGDTGVVWDDKNKKFIKFIILMEETATVMNDPKSEYLNYKRIKLMLTEKNTTKIRPNWGWIEVK